MICGVVVHCVFYRMHFYSFVSLFMIRFDACYGSDADQEMVFGNECLPLLPEAFNGKHITVFAYGMTGSCSRVHRHIKNLPRFIVSILPPLHYRARRHMQHFVSCFTGMVRCTGSGKTHTIQGYGSGPKAGLLPRAVVHLLHHAQSHDTDAIISISFLEVYNDKVGRDLSCSYHHPLLAIHLFQSSFVASSRIHH
jgi:hypothetical protein